MTRWPYACGLAVLGSVSMAVSADSGSASLKVGVTVAPSCTVTRAPASPEVVRVQCGRRAVPAVITGESVIVRPSGERSGTVRITREPASRGDSASQRPTVVINF
jgi:hypothetical protein